MAAEHLDYPENEEMPDLMGDASDDDIPVDPSDDDDDQDADVVKARKPGKPTLERTYGDEFVDWVRSFVHSKG